MTLPTDEQGGATPDRLFIIGTQYALPGYLLRLPDGFPGFLHASGIRVQVGTTPMAVLACAAESDHSDVRVLRLLRQQRNGDLDESGLEELRPFSLRVRTAHRAAAEEVVRVIRWVTARDEGREAIGDRTDAKWSEDGANWYRFSTGPDAPRSDIGWGAFDFDAAWTSYVRQRLDAGDTEPIGHELWQEAKAQLDANPRSAVVMAVAALEAGVRQQVARLGGRASEAKGPDILAMLHGFVRSARPERWIELPHWFNRVLDQGVAARNRLVHAGAAPPAREELLVLLRAVRDVLYLFDYQRGDDWAFAYLAFPAGEGVAVTGLEPVIRGEMTST